MFFSENAYDNGKQWQLYSGLMMWEKIYRRYVLCAISMTNYWREQRATLMLMTKLAWVPQSRQHHATARLAQLGCDDVITAVYPTKYPYGSVVLCFCSCIVGSQCIHVVYSSELHILWWPRRTLLATGGEYLVFWALIEYGGNADTFIYSGKYYMLLLSENREFSDSLFWLTLLLQTLEFVIVR